jgi:hypothetical protein
VDREGVAVPLDSSGIGPGIALPLEGVVRISVDEPFGPEGSPHKGWGISSTKRIGKRLSLRPRRFAIDNVKSWLPLLGEWKSPASEEWEGRGVVKGD